MGSRLGGDTSEVIADINITPFVDIILVVLIIFMVTATTIVKQSIKVELPEASTAEGTPDDSIGVTITQTGQLLLDGEPTTVEGLQNRLHTDKSAGKDVV